MSFDVRFRQGSSILVCGPSGSGKTSLVSNIIIHKKLLFDRPPEKVFLFYTHHQDIYDDLLKRGIISKMFDGYPSYDEIKKIVLPYKKSGGSIIILDDQLSGLSDDIVRIFHELSHHCNTTCFFFISKFILCKQKI